MTDDASNRSADYLRARLSRLGGSVGLAGRKLRLSLPPGALTPALRRSVETHRDALVATLAGDSDRGPAAPVRAPLTPFQTSFWTMHLREDADLATLHASLVLPIRGDLDARRLAAAVALLGQRHAGLRLRVESQADGPPVQVCGGVPVLDTAPDDGDADARIRALTGRRFDLKAEAPLRLLLLTGARSHRLVLVGHHIAVDGWSIGLILRDLFALYTAGDDGALTQVNVDPIALAAKLAAQARSAGMIARATEAAQLLHGLPLCRSLPSDRPRSKRAGADGGEVGFTLPPAAVVQLTGLARQAGGGLYSALLATFGLVYASLTGLARLPVMSPVANRAGAEPATDIVACLANGVILAPYLPATLTMRQAVARAARAVSQALDQQDIPYDMVIDALGHPRVPGVFPGAQVYLALQDAASLPQVEGLSLGPASLPHALSRQDLLIEFRHLPDGGLACRISYDVGLFDSARIETLADRMRRGLLQAARSPDQPLPPAAALPSPDTDMSLSGTGSVACAGLDLIGHAAQVIQTGLVADAALSCRHIGGAARCVVWVVPSDSALHADLRDRLLAAVPQLPRDVLLVRLAALPRDRDGILDRHWLALLPVTDPAIMADLPTAPVLSPTARPAPEAVSQVHATTLLPPVASGCSSFPDLAPASEATVAVANGDCAAEYQGPPLPLKYPAQGWSPSQWLDHSGTLTCIEHDGATRVRPLEEVRDRALRIAAGLRAAGLGPGDGVILAPRRVENYLTAFFGATSAGLRVALMAPAASQSADTGAAAIRHIGRIAETGAVITDADDAWVPPGFSAFHLDQLMSCDPSPEPFLWQPDQPVLIGFTSGSTGLPKGVPLRALNIWSMPQAFGPPFHLSPDAHALNFTGLDHVASLIGFCGGALAAGASLSVLASERFVAVPESVLHAMAAYGITHSWAPDFAWKLVAVAAEAEAPDSLNLHRLQRVFSGGEAPLRATFTRLTRALARHGGRAELHTAWGMAETTSIFTLSAPWTEAGSHADNAGVLDSGVALPGQAMRVVAGDGRVLGDGQTGLLQVCGPSVFQGYTLADADGALSHSTPLTPDGWLETGDLAYTYQGRLMLLGREKDVIVLNGRNVAQAAVEDVIDALPGIRHGFSTAIAVRESRRGTQRLVTFFVPEDEVLTDDGLRRVLDAVADAVTAAHGSRPDVILPLRAEDVPKTSLGKIQRQHLRRAFASGAFEGIAARVDHVRGGGRLMPARLFQRRKERIAPLATAAATAAACDGRVSLLTPQPWLCTALISAGWKITDDRPDLLIDATAMSLTAPDADAIAAEALRRRDLALNTGARRILWLEAPDFGRIGHALASSVEQEVEGLRCGSLTMAVEAGANLAGLLARTGLKGHMSADSGLSVERLVPVPAVPPEDWRDLPMDAAILVPGGLGRVGRLILPQLLDLTGWRFVLIGRHPEAGRLAALIQGLTDPGRVAYEMADAADAQAMVRIADAHGAVACLNLAGSMDQTGFAAVTLEAVAKAVSARIAVCDAMTRALSRRATPGTDPVVVHVTSAYARLGRRDHLAYSTAHAAEGAWIDARRGCALANSPRHVELTCGQWQDPDGAADKARTDLAARQGFGLIDAQAGAVAVIRAMLGPEDRLVLGLDPQGIETRAMIAQPPRSLDRIVVAKPTPEGTARAAEAGVAVLHRASEAWTPGGLSELEANVMALWQRVLGSGRAFDADANFFDAGGNSLLVARLHHLMTEAFGGPSALTSLFSHPTIRSQAALLLSDAKRSDEAPPTRARRPVNDLAKRRCAARVPAS